MIESVGENSIGVRQNKQAGGTRRKIGNADARAVDGSGTNQRQIAGRAELVELPWPRQSCPEIQRGGCRRGRLVEEQDHDSRARLVECIRAKRIHIGTGCARAFSANALAVAVEIKIETESALNQ